MPRPGIPRTQLLALAAILLLLIVVQVAIASGDGATESASVTKQIKTLKRRVAALEAKPSPAIPTSLPPSGAAGGDLAGTYPGPAVKESALDLGGDLGGTVANAQLAPGSVGPGELGTIPAARATATSSQVFNNGETDVIVGLGTEDFDTANLYQGDDLITVPIAGTYLLMGTISWAGQAPGFRQLIMRVNTNGVALTEQAGNSTSETQEVITLTRLQAGDLVDLVGFQNSGGMLGTSAQLGEFASLAVQWLGP